MRPWPLLALLMALAPAARAQGEDGEIAALKRDFEFGKYDEAYERAQARLDSGGITDPQLLLEVHLIAGISAFNTGKQKEAARHLSAVLRLDPDYALDPFVYPPPTINFLERLRKELDPELAGIRQERRAAAARRRAEAEAQERGRLQGEEQRQRAEAASHRVTIRNIERRSYIVNFVPFGAGQFQQGRNNLGIVLASTEGALAAVSVVAYWAHEGLYQTKTYAIPGARTPDGQPYQIQVTGIPPDRATEAQVWRLVKTLSAFGFYALYAYGTVDALLKHQDAIVTTQVVEEPQSPSPAERRPGSPPLGIRKRAAPARPSASAFLLPVPGGLAACAEILF